MALSRSNILNVLLLLFVCIAGLPLTTALASDASPVDPLNPEAAYGSQVSYAIFRNNKRIGDHTVSFVKENEELRVSVASNLVVTILKIPVYRFNYEATELWRNGVLQEVISTVKEKGKTRSVSLKRQGNKTLLTEPSGDTTLTSLDFASNHWHPGVLETPAIFNTLTGKANNISITNKGVETVPLGEDTITATHFHYSGELQTDVWYDDRQRWVKLRFQGSDGSTIEYRCEGFNT